MRNLRETEMNGHGLWDVENLAVLTDDEDEAVQCLQHNQQTSTPQYSRHLSTRTTTFVQPVADPEGRARSHDPIEDEMVRAE